MVLDVVAGAASLRSPAGQSRTMANTTVALLLLLPDVYLHEQHMQIKYFEPLSDINTLESNKGQTLFFH